MSVTLEPRRAFHSTLSTTPTLDLPGPDCSFFVLYTLPQSIIVDRHELVDHRLSFEFWGESNLELPVFALDQSAVSVLLINATPADALANQVTVDIPIHARYGEPSVASLQSITISAPACFWACARSGGPAFSTKAPVANSSMLGSLAYFSMPSASLDHVSLQVPVASRQDLVIVEIGTAAVMFVAFLWLAYRSWKAGTTLQSRHLKQQ